MLETSARLLRLLSLLQTRKDWTGPDLAERLQVSSRTVRTDIGKLRTLGYPIDAVSGVAGGYRLGAGSEMPPLLLDDEEAVAVAVGLRTAAGGSIVGIEETSLSALAKLERVLPSRLRSRVNAVQSHTVPLMRRGAPVDAGLLASIAVACRDCEGLRFDYSDHFGALTPRSVEPHRMVNTGYRWYLVAWDLDRADWRTFRVDRITLKTPGGRRFSPRPPPDSDLAAYVARGVGSQGWRYRATLRLMCAAADVRDVLPIDVLVEDHGAVCVIHAGADTLHMLAIYVLMVDVDFEVLDSPELVAELDRLARRITGASGVQDLHQ